jgi:hypothetical protein
MLSQKPLVNVSIDPYPGKFGNQRPKSARSATHSTRIASFHPFSVAASSHCCLGIIYLETKAPTDAEARGDLGMVLYCGEL